MVSIYVLFLLLVYSVELVGGDFLDFLGCNVCDIQKNVSKRLPYGNQKILDCQCDFSSTHEAVKVFFSPLLDKICDRCVKVLY